LKGYQAALKDNNIKFDEKLLIVTKLEEKECINATNQLLHLKNKIDGVFTTSDFSAAICIQTIKKAGLRVPQDIAVAGFNNDAISTIIEPKLTTINYSGYNMGQTAARMLIDHLTGKINISSTNTVVLNSELIVRESTKRK
jgi:LacI family transcriptional regulator